MRAEALRPGTAEDGAIRGTVEHSEALGHETLTAVGVGGVDGIRLIVRLPAMQELAKGQPIGLSIDADCVYLFDENGRTL